MWYAPWEKLFDAALVILAGGTSMSQIDTLIRPDKALQIAFGRWQCASSSEIQKSLDRCDAEAVSHLQMANRRLYQQHGNALKHPFAEKRLLLDVDLTGLLASKHAEESTKGYFADHRGHTGRQLCRLIATDYQEIVMQALVPGNTVSQVMLRPALQEAQEILTLSDSMRRQTLLRWDAGFGTDGNINWMLSRQYQILGKVFSSKRVHKLAKSVTEWVKTAAGSGREYGVVTTPHRYARKTRQLIVRTPKRSPAGTWAYGALVSTDLDASPLSLIALYDARGGGVETDFRTDRQGLGLGKRRKRHMAAQQMLIHLTERVHNMLVWTANELGPPLNTYGALRLVRDVFQVDGYLLVKQGRLLEIGLNRFHPAAWPLCQAFNRLLGGTPCIKLWSPAETVKEPQRG